MHYRIKFLNFIKPRLQDSTYSLAIDLERDQHAV